MTPAAPKLQVFQTPLPSASRPRHRSRSSLQSSASNSSLTISGSRQSLITPTRPNDLRTPWEEGDSLGSIAEGVQGLELEGVEEETEDFGSDNEVEYMPPRAEGTIPSLFHG